MLTYLIFPLLNISLKQKTKKKFKADPMGNLLTTPFPVCWQNSISNKNCEFMIKILKIFCYTPTYTNLVLPVVNTYMSCSLYLLYHFIGSKRLNEWKLHLAYDLILYFILFWIFFWSFPNFFFLINYSLSRRILKYYAYNFDGMLYLLDLISIKMHTALMIPKSFIDFEFDCS